MMSEKKMGNESAYCEDSVPDDEAIKTPGTSGLSARLHWRRDMRRYTHQSITRRTDRNNAYIGAARRDEREFHTGYYYLRS